MHWLDNFALKLPTYGTTLGAASADVTAAVNDARWYKYVLGSWLGAVRNFAPSTTDAVDDVLTGTLNLALSDPPTRSEVPQFLDASNALPNHLTRV